MEDEIKYDNIEEIKYWGEWWIWESSENIIWNFNSINFFLPFLKKHWWWRRWMNSERSRQHRTFSNSTSHKRTRSDWLRRMRSRRWWWWLESGWLGTHGQWTTVLSTYHRLQWPGSNFARKWEARSSILMELSAWSWIIGWCIVIWVKWWRIYEAVKGTHRFAQSGCQWIIIVLFAL